MNFNVDCLYEFTKERKSGNFESKDKKRKRG